MKINNIEELKAAQEKYKYIPVELSPYQIKMMDNQLYTPNSRMWNNPVYIKFNKDINIGELRDAVEVVLSNHPALNLRIYMDTDGVIRQQYCPQFIPILTRNVSDEEIETIWENFARPFTIFNSPLMRLEIYKTPTAAYLLIDAHHLVVDATTGGIIMNDIVETYLDKDKVLEPDYYIGYMALEREYKLTEEYALEKEFYENAYKGEDWYIIPTPDINTTKNENDSFDIYLGVDIQTLAQAERNLRTTRSRIANMAALLALSKYGNADNVMMTWIYHNRMGLGKERMAGLLITELPIAARLKEFETLGDLILHVNKQMKETTKNTSYDYIVKNEATFKNDPLEVNYRGKALRQEKYGDKLAGEYDLSFIEYHAMEEEDVAEARMELDVFEYPEETPDKQLLMNVNYMSSLYKEGSVEKFAQLYAQMFKRIAEASKDTKIVELLK